MGAVYRDAHAGDAGAKGGMVHDLAAFVLQLHLLLGVTIGEERIHVRDDVEGDLVRINLLRHGLALDDLQLLALGFANTLCAAAGRSTAGWLETKTRPHRMRGAADKWPSR